MPKEKNYNPVQAAKKQEKQKQLKKQKATVQAQRNEKLARRNPNRIQRDIDNLKDLAQSGDLRPHERQRLSELEKDLAAVNKAREALGEKAPQFRPERRDDDGGHRGGRGSHGGGRGGILGKRTRDGQRKEDGSSDTDPDVRDIPMPRDTPPPIPRRHGQQANDETEAAPEVKKATVVYEAAPQIRDIRKETTRFMPAAVAEKIRLAKGDGRLLEPEEFDKLQDGGYMDKNKTSLDSRNAGLSQAAEEVVDAAVEEAEYKMMADEGQGIIRDTESEAKVAETRLHQVELEEVEDDDY